MINYLIGFTQHFCGNMGVFILNNFCKFLMIFLAPIINMNSHVSIIFVFRNFHAGSFFGSSLTNQCLLEKIVLFSNQPVFVLFNSVSNIHPTLNLILHFIITNCAEPFERHSGLAIAARVLKIELNLKIVTKLFVF